MEKNRLLEKYRKESQVLNPIHNVMNDTFNPSDINNLKSWLARIHGAPGKNGTYYDPRGDQPWPSDRTKERGFVDCKLSRLQDQLQDLDEDFKKYAQERVNRGDRKPEEWPERLKKRKQELEAKILVAHEEVDRLNDLIAAALEKQPHKESLLKHPKDWGSGRLHNGQLVSIGPWDVVPDPDQDNILCVKDSSSPFDGMPVWQFKSEVVNPIHWEYRYRQRREMHNAEVGNRKRRDVGWPEIPSWDPETGQVEYKGYSNEIIKKIKQDTG